LQHKNTEHIGIPDNKMHVNTSPYMLVNQLKVTLN